MKSVGYHRLAENELIRSAVFYERRRRFLGEQFLVAVEDAVASLRSNPAIGRREKHETRSLRVRRFPFRVIYQEQADRVWVVAVAHLSRKPRYWERRLAN